MSWSSPADVTGSSPAEGSSRNRIAGSSAIARAIAARFCMPPLTSAGKLSAKSFSPTSSSFIRAIRSIASSGSVGVFLQRQTDVLRERHRAEQRPALVRNADAAQCRKPLVALGGGDVDAIEPDMALHRRMQPDQMLEQRALAAARTAEDREYLAVLHLEIQVVQDRIAAVADGQMLDPNDGLVHALRTPRTLKITANTLSAGSTRMMPPTTACVVD